MSWTPVIDVSQHQGAINFATMRAKGVQHLILRATHGKTLDSRVASYYEAAVAAGYAPNRIGFYSFINPKRGSGEATAVATATAVQSITDRTAVLYMLDVESYRNEGPLKGESPVRGYEFSAYLREHMATFRALMPGCCVMAYSNRSYWNGPDGAQDAQLASELDWIVPRYPIYSTASYDRLGYPPAPAQWDEYAFKLAAGPMAPLGAQWHGWQLSAGYNRQGPPYGCASSDLDLNFVDTAFADKWFADHAIPVPPPPAPVPPITAKEPDVLIPHDGSRLFREMVLADVPTTVAVAPNTPPTATGVALNITFNGSMRPGFATLWSGVGPMPNVSMINWMPTATPSNSFTIVPIHNGSFVVQAMEEVNLIFDQVGYTMPPVAGPQGPPGAPGAGATDEQIVDAVVRELTD